MSKRRTPLQRLLAEEDGQALLYGAGVVMVTVALFYGAIDVGQLVLGKIQAQNAADAAALAASGLKVSVHNTRSLAYRATTGQIVLTRLKLVQATGMVLNELTGAKSKPGEFNKAIKLAGIHRKKVERLRKGLLSFNRQVTDPEFGARVVRQAAEMAYLGNLGTLGVVEPSNLRLLHGDSALPENGEGAFVGGVTYKAESLSSTGHAGKTLVAIKPKVNAFGGGLLGYATSAQLTAYSVAGPLPAQELYGKMQSIEDYGVEWYTIRLMPIGKGNLP